MILFSARMGALEKKTNTLRRRLSAEREFSIKGRFCWFAFSYATSTQLIEILLAINTESFWLATAATVYTCSGIFVHPLGLFNQRSCLGDCFCKLLIVIEIRNKIFCVCDETGGKYVYCSTFYLKYHRELQAMYFDDENRPQPASQYLTWHINQYK